MKDEFPVLQMKSAVEEAVAQLNTQSVFCLFSDYKIVCILNMLYLKGMSDGLKSAQEVLSYKGE